MNLFVIMMLLNMALVWLMMYFSICLMIIISICSMIIVSREYFEITFISRKKRIVLTVRLRLFTFRYQVSTISESNLLCFAFWYDIWLSFANEQAKFSYTKLFSSGEPRIFYWRKYPIIYIFSYTAFYARLGPYPCVEIKFLKKGDSLLCQILIILQC